MKVGSRRATKIAFFRPGTGMPANVSFHSMLEAAFPEFEVIVVDVGKRIRARWHWRAIGTICALKEYGWQILSGRKRLGACLSKTAWYQSRVRELVRELTACGDYEFSIQIQSLFDASTPGMRHFVYTDHTHLANLAYESFDRRSLFSKRWIARERATYQNATAVFVRSTNIRRSLIEDYGCSPGRVECVYAGSNAALPTSPVDMQKYSAQNILFVGLDWNRKGGPLLVAAFRQLLRTHPEARLTIVGASPPVDVPNCDVAGRVPIDRVAQYFASATVFCMPTRLEPFGIVFVEALSHSLPIVATNVGAVPDMVVDGVNGYLVAPGDVSSTVRRLRELIADPAKCAQFGSESRKLAESRYNWQAVGTKIRAVILDGKADACIEQSSRSMNGVG